ncbi:sigma-70 family RNA polymerase sigma factor [Saccharopolyspora sp. HNM0983]|uniref:Sigma-70 family RNA polymerase sigma factor n=1 Tax=Saccharopolyspora montiporae TaxID=2781240 RepID=A0A929BFJ1_9PSEU|nr:sigma-70 family RNA polymerase sigma factor [Saccharopolyspora sp. HNM0983]
MEPSERALVVAVEELAAGDHRAAEQLYHWLWERVTTAVVQILRDAAQAEEVAQEVLTEVWLSAGKYRPERGGVLNWVLVLARRRAVDRVRSVQAAARREARYGARLVERPFDQVVEQAVSRWEHAQVRRAIEELSELQRESVLLVHYCGYSSQEAAEILGVPRTTFKTRLRDAVVRLRGELPKEPAADGC